MMEEMLDMAGDLGLVVAVHTGMGAFASASYIASDPEHMIPIIERHPGTKFDLFHMGIPHAREAAMIGKNFPNAWLNLCWCHVISPSITRGILDELIDLVPVNKIIAFGGDYGIPVENVYGHLVMARENVAKVLGQRVEEGHMTENEAVDVAGRWFYENPKELYGLDI
jgi:predicted TIM-barrel fold metal-dependent hydrolase